MSKKEWLEAERNYRKALELLDDSLSGDHGDIVPFYIAVGKFKRAHEILEEMQLNDPINQGILPWEYIIYCILEKRQRAEEEYQSRNKAMSQDEMMWHNQFITLARLGSGDKLSRNEIVSSLPIHTLGKKHIDSPENGLLEMRRIFSSDENLSSRDLSRISMWAGYFGDPEFVIKVFEERTRLSAGGIFYIWLPVFKEVRQLPQFKELIKEIGLVDYWEEYGWPDTGICRPVGDDDFECD